MSQVFVDLQFEHEKATKTNSERRRRRKKEGNKRFVPKVSNLGHIEPILE